MKMIGYFVFFVLTLCLMGRGEAAEGDTMLNNNGVYVKLMGKSGTVMASRSMDTDKDAKNVKLSFDEIRFVNGSVTTNRMDFTAVSFKSENVTDGKFGNTDINAKVVTATAALPAPINGTFQVMVYIAKGTGNIKYDDETTTVADGDVKVSLKLSKFTFPDQNTLELVLSVKGTAGKPEQKSNNRTSGLFYDLGDGSSVIFSRKVKMDENSTFKNMTNGFPKEMAGKIVLSFNNFTSVMYDPIITVGNSTSDDTSGGSLGPVMSYTLLFALAFLMCQLIA